MRYFILGRSAFQKPLLATRVAEHQKKGRTCAWVSIEEPPFDLLRTHGVDVTQLLISTPDNTRQAHEIVDTLAKSGAVDVIMFSDRLLFPTDHMVKH